MIQKLDFAVLSAFVTVVETQSFQSAARELGRTPSAVSMQIRKLEDRFGQSMLDRKGNGVELTLAGERLFPYAKSLVEQAAEAGTALEAPTLSGEVRLGLPEWFATTRLQALIARFMRAHPNVRLKIQADASSALYSAVRSDELDMALAIVDDIWDQRSTVYSERLCWVAGHHQPLRIGDDIPLALFDAPCPYRSVAMRSLHANDWSWRETFTSSSVSTVRNAVKAGLGLSVFPESAVTEDLRVLGESDGFPALPNTDLGIYEQPGARSATHRTLTRHLADTIREITRLPIDACV